MKALLSLSGGLDSTVMLAYAIARGREVSAITFNYGSKHSYFERMAAANVARHYGVPHTEIDLVQAMSCFKSNLLYGGDDIPEGHYEEETMKQTVVPCRNLIFLSLMAGYAQSQGIEEIWIGVHAGDHAIYPDCRPAFIRSAEATINFAMGSNHTFILTPFLGLGKEDIVERGVGLTVPFKMTRTCYKQQHIACGKCGSCQERLAAFADNGLEDPLVYESREILPRKS